jgi:hypothetical protein
LASSRTANARFVSAQWPRSSTASDAWTGSGYDPNSATEEASSSTTPKATTDVDKARKLKQELLDLAARTNRGFQATEKQRRQARDLIFRLGDLNPTAEPARDYYEKNAASDNNARSDATEPTISGKWTLMYTDAPDITSLDTSQNNNGNPRLVELGRIGQECSGGQIKNVIEWKRPAWMADWPLSGGSSMDTPRVLQKVVTAASASPSKPTVVDLKLAGIQVTAADTDTDTATAAATDNTANPLQELSQAIQSKGLIAGLLQSRPINLQGPWNAPFGQFEILYLDEQLRIIKTGQNFVAVNLRMNASDAWF